ncbi:uncharacterized protein LOC116405582 [Cucumis sativus]|uniref:uncharacterized protein LOC116405582 n=1 Tax=Cucumis sativus TaxID=3659 RepID=UPI0012F4FE8B|nr:uncharacterized protein LOC116405582 [Cucumis sativus]
MTSTYLEKLGRYSWYQSLSFRFCRLTYDVSLCFCVPMANATLRLSSGIMPPRGGVRRGGRRGRGRGAGRNQPTEGQAEQRIPAAPVTHVEFDALSAHMEQRFTELMTAIARNQQAPAVPPAPVVPLYQQLHLHQQPLLHKDWLHNSRRYYRTNFLLRRNI